MRVSAHLLHPPPLTEKRIVVPVLKSDVTVCQGYANCVETAPDAYDVGDDGKVVLLRQDITEAEQPRFEEAVRSCPMNALRIEDA